MADSGDTFIFKPEEPEKKPIEKEKVARTEVDEFTIARKVKDYDDEEEKEETSSLTTVAYVLGALLVVAIVAVVIFLTSSGEEAPSQKPAPEKVTLPATDDSDEDEEKEEEEVVIKDYTLAYNGGNIYEIENDGGFSVVFEVYDKQNKKTGDKKMYINEETVIKDGNSKIRLDSFITFIENQGGDIIFFDCEVRENDKVINSIKYSSEGFGEEEEEIPDEEENNKEEPSQNPTTPEKPVPEKPVPEKPSPEPTNPEPTTPEEPAPETETEETAPITE